MTKSSSSPLRQHGLKETLARRTIFDVLIRAKHPLSIQQMQQNLEKGKQRVGIVTIYRVVEALVSVGLVHRYADGRFSACSQPDLRCGHILLFCTSCGTQQETHDHDLCKREESLSKRLRFSPTRGVREIAGICSHCR